MEAAIAAAKAEAIADAKGKVETLAATVAANLTEAKNYADAQDAITLAAANAYAAAYTDELFDSIKFVTEGDIDNIFKA